MTIVDDEVLENVESFTVTLERTPGLDMRIALNPVNGRIEITDNDGILLNICAYGAVKSVFLSSGYCGSAEDHLHSDGGCGCGGSVCYCV